MKFTILVMVLSGILQQGISQGTAELRQLRNSSGEVIDSIMIEDWNISYELSDLNDLNYTQRFETRFHNDIYAGLDVVRDDGTNSELIKNRFQFCVYRYDGCNLKRSNYGVGTYSVRLPIVDDGLYFCIIRQSGLRVTVYRYELFQGIVDISRL